MLGSNGLMNRAMQDQPLLWHMPLDPNPNPNPNPDPDLAIFGALEELHSGRIEDHGLCDGRDSGLGLVDEGHRRQLKGQVEGTQDD